MVPLLLVFTDVALLILRLATGAIFAAHGAKKLKNLAATQAWFNEQGFKPGKLWGALVAFVELAGGFMLIVGLLTQLAGIALLPVMGVAIAWKLKNREKFIGGYELDLALLAGLLVLAASGSQLFSLDTAFGILLF